MQRIISALIFAVCLSLLSVSPAKAWFFGSDTLLTIDGTDYSTDDFKRWWKFWNSENGALPETPDPYVDWLLLGQEGRRMELDSNPGFQRQTRIFLQSRTLLMLKYENVDSQIKVTDADVRKRYEEQYLPIWLVQRIEFKSEDDALNAWQQLSKGEMTVEALLERDPEQGGPVSYGDTVQRANLIDAGWADIFKAMKAGEVVDPEKHKGGKILYRLKDVKGFDAEDFASLKDELRKRMWKEEEDALTQKLIDKLKKEYQVQVDEERLASLELFAPDEAYGDEPVITSNRQNVSEKEFIAVVRKLLANRGPLAHAASEPEQIEELKAITAENIIAQSVTNWGSLDRHFEKEEPFKWEYEFNYNHRLTLELERRLFSPEAEVSDEEVRQHYEKYKNRYSMPTQVKLYIIDETQGPIDKVWAEVATGKNFDQMVKEHFESHAKLYEAPVNHLDPEVRKVVEKLVDGETSQIFKAQGSRVMAHLVERIPAVPLPFEKVAESIRKELWRMKFNKIKSEYLEKLKSQSEISINMDKWKKIKKELEEA